MQEMMQQATYYVALENSPELEHKLACNNRVSVVESMGEFHNVNQAISEFGKKFNNIEHCLFGYQLKESGNKIARIYRVDTLNLGMPVVH